MGGEVDTLTLEVWSVNYKHNDLPAEILLNCTGITDPPCAAIYLSNVMDSY